MTFDFITYNTNNETLSFISFTKNFLMPLVAAGFGAFAGGWFSQRNKLNNDFKKDIQYLNYANSILLSLLNSLYSFKKQFITSDNVKKEMQLLESVKDDLLDVYLKKDDMKSVKEKFNQFNWLNKKIIQANYNFPINEEKLNILATINVNIYTLILGCKESLEMLNRLTEQLNQHIQLVEIDIVKYAKPDSGFYQKLYELRMNLSINIDDCINNLDLLMKCINKSAKILLANNKKYKITFNPLIAECIEEELVPQIQSQYSQLIKWIKE